MAGVAVQVVGLPDLARLTGKRFVVEPAPATVDQLVEVLCRRFGDVARQHLLDATGRIDPFVQVLVNQRPAVPRNSPLADGDTVIFMLMAAGG